MALLQGQGRLGVVSLCSVFVIQCRDFGYGRRMATMTTATDYLKSIYPFAGTEEQALHELIESHKRQRLLIGDYVSRYVNSPEGRAWAEQVSQMTLSECIELFANVQQQKSSA